MDDDPLLGWGLRPVEIADQAKLVGYFGLLNEPLSDYTFSQLYTWRNSLRILWTEIHGHLCVFANGAGDLTLLMPPIGDGSGDRAMAGAFELMDAYNAAKGVPDHSRVEYASGELLSRFDRARLRVQPLGTDYIYDVRHMIELPGGHLASKRQAKNRFMRNYPYRVEAYDVARHLQPCLDLLSEWKAHQDAHRSEDPSTNAIKRQKESLACELTLRQAPELGLRGMVVYVTRPGLPEAIRAFTFGELLGRDQSSITIEKTDLQVKGLAQFIFSEFCRTHWADRPLVNVGDDWGLETLAWTKMSYRPVKLLQKYVLRAVPVTKVAVPPQNVAPLIQQAPQTTIRAARKDDLAAAVELEKACFTEFCLTKRQLQYLQGRPSAIFLVAEQNGQIVGQGIALVRNHRRVPSGRIYSLSVRSDLRGQKIGQRLLQAMLRELQTRGVQRVYLEVDQANTSAIHLYQINGFRNLGVLPNYYGEGRDGWHMMYPVPAPAPVLAAVP